ncbi:MAG: hypothetical protein ACM3O3_12920 [Syntrophothermus sp.]
MKELEKAINKMNSKVVVYTTNFESNSRFSNIRFANFYGRIKDDNFVLSGNIHGRSVTLPMQYIKKVKNKSDKVILDVNFGNGKDNMICLNMSNQDGIVSKRRY